MARFHFVTDWDLRAPIDRVWSVVTDYERFPTWWPGFVRAERTSHDGSDAVRYRVRTSFGATLDFVQYATVEEPPRHLVFRTAGDLVGHGRIDLAVRERGTGFRFVWDVELGRPLLAAASRIGAVKRVLERSHHRLMAAGHRALAAMIEGR